MASPKIEETIQKYFKLGRSAVAILMIIFGVLILILPDILAILVALYLIINGILVLVEEYSRK